MLKTALQLYSVREDLKQNFDETLKIVGKMGYEGVELVFDSRDFANFCGKTADEMIAACKTAGVKPISAHIEFSELVRDAEGYAAYCQKIGCIQMVIPYLDRACLPHGELYEETAANIRKVSAVAKAHGLHLAYHNHDFEFEKIGDDYLLDVLYQEFDPSVLQTQIDTCWVNVGGENPADYIIKYTGRAPTVHIKDFVGTKGNQPPYALIGKEGGGAESGSFEFRSVGSGAQNVTSLLKASEQAGAGWVIVEQDSPSSGYSALTCAEMSIQYLNGIAI
ncbi:MAG: sugar phosphate isomerase/epimerase [Clostridiales bacterium]|nr:sugar phosphate isomerase/epimerase [Clostridiales bacterium]